MVLMMLFTYLYCALQVEIASQIIILAVSPSAAAEEVLGEASRLPSTGVRKDAQLAARLTSCLHPCLPAPSCSGTSTSPTNVLKCNRWLLKYLHAWLWLQLWLTCIRWQPPASLQGSTEPDRGPADLRQFAWPPFAYLLNLQKVTWRDSGEVMSLLLLLRFAEILLTQSSGSL